MRGKLAKTLRKVAKLIALKPEAQKLGMSERQAYQQLKRQYHRNIRNGFTKSNRTGS